MKAPDEITIEIDEVKQKINSLSIEKTEKVEEIEDLKASNVRLLVSNTGKERKPLSIGSQTNRITTLLTEIQQLDSAIKVLEEQQTILQDEFECSTLRQELVGYYEESDSYLRLAADINADFQILVEHGKNLAEKVDAFNAQQIPLLGNIQQIFRKCGTYKRFQALNFNWGTEQQKYKMCSGLIQQEEELKNLLKKIKRVSDTFFFIEANVFPSVDQSIPR